MKHDFQNESTFNEVPVYFTENEVTTRCLSRSKKVLDEEARFNNPLNDRFYYELFDYSEKNEADDKLSSKQAE